MSAGHAKAKAPENVPLPSSSKKNKPSDPWANYSTAASLGYQDPDAERLAAEAGLKQIQGVAGEWEVVAPVKPEGAGAGVGGDQNGDTVPSETIGTKRPVESVFDEEDTRAFKLRKKTLPVGLAAVDDDIISIKIKKRHHFKNPQNQTHLLLQRLVGKSTILVGYWFHKKIQSGQNWSGQRLVDQQTKKTNKLSQKPNEKRRLLA